MAAANPATVAGSKGFDPNLTRQRLRAAQREAAKGTQYRPDASSELAAAVAQLATSATVTIRTQDELSTVRVHKKGAVDTGADQKEEPQIPKAAKPTRQKVEEKKPEPASPPKQQKEEKASEKKALSKKERRALRRQEQAAKRALAEEQKREKRKVAEKQKQQRLAEKQQATAKPKAKVVAKPKATQSGRQEEKSRYVRLCELRAKYNLYPEEVVDASSLSAKAAMCNFDFSVYLKLLLDGEPKQASAYLSTVANHSKPLGQAIISPYLDEICDALHSGRSPDEILHSHEPLESHVKQSFEDPLVRKSTTQLLHDEGGMHLYDFSQTVYVTVKDGEGGILQAERKYIQTVHEYRTKAYISWLERNAPIPKGSVDLRAFDRKGNILNDFSLQFVTDTVPIMVGNLQVGMEFRMSEQYVPLSWEVVRFKHQLNRKDSQVCRKNRGKDPIAGIVGIEILEGLVEAGPAAANDDVVPWEEEPEFVPLPNPKLGDRQQIIEVPRSSNEHPESKDHLHLLPEPATVSWEVTGNYPKWVDRSSEKVQEIFLASMTEPDKPVGLRSNPEYRWDPGPPEATDNVVRGPDSWFDNTPHVIGHEFVGPPKQPVVGAVTRKQDALQQKARRLLRAKCPAPPEGHRSWTYEKDKRYGDIPVELIKYWKIQFSKDCRAIREWRQYNNWQWSRDVFNGTYDEERYVNWLRDASVNDTLYPDTLQEHLGNMEDLVPSTVYDYECHLCDERIRERELDADLRKQSMVRNSFGMMVLDHKLYQFKKHQMNKHKAEQVSAGKGSAKIGEPGIRATSSVKSNQDTSGGGQSQIRRDARGYDLSNFTPEERDVFIAHMEGRQIEIPWWRKVNQLKPSKLIDKAAEFWATRGTLLVPPAYG